MSAALAFPGGKLVIVLAGGPLEQTFVEIENVNGISHAVGNYIARADGLTALEIDLAAELSRQAPLTR
jgi:hypothetical protein